MCTINEVEIIKNKPKFGYKMVRIYKSAPDKVTSYFRDGYIWKVGRNVPIVTSNTDFDAKVFHFFPSINSKFFRQ